MSTHDVDVRHRIIQLVESVRGDNIRSQELFQYVWTMICVRRGLMRIVREIATDGDVHLVVEEVKTGRRRRVCRPEGLDGDVEGLAVDALARMLEFSQRAG